MASISSSKHVKLASQLPPQLQRFFARYPPQSKLDPQSSSTLPPPSLSPQVSSLQLARSFGATREIIDYTNPNPFRAWKHPETGAWHNPVYSLRRQADLFKLARQHGVEELLPLSIKSTEERLRRREEHGLRVKGTGVGERVKGKEWERTLKGRLEKRRQAMLNMPQMIQTWKERGHGRGWKKWPK